MNKKLLALAIGVAAVVPVVAQADGPTLYGKMNVTLDDIVTNDAKVPAVATNSHLWKADSNASRIGVRGEADTGVDGLKGIYQAEFGIDVTDGTGPFSQRDIFAGLASKDWGTLKAGYFDTPMKASRGDVDEFKDYLGGDVKYVLAGQNRAANIVQYSSPKLADMITVNVAAMPGEGTNLGGAGGTTTHNSTAFSTSVVLKKDAFYAALAHDQNIAASVSGGPTSGAAVDGFTYGDITRGVVGYSEASFEVGAIYQQAKTNDANAAAGSLEDKAYLVSGAYKTGDWKFKAQYGQAKGNVTDDKQTMAIGGVDYKLGKSTTVFAYADSVKTTTAFDKKVSTMGLGLEQKF